MVNQMDMFSQSAFTKLEKTDVNTVIGDLVHLIRPSLFKPADITLTFRPDNNLPKIMASRDALKQVIINLLKNAAEAMADGGDVTVATSRVAKDQYKGGTPPADGIEIVVEDTGPGLPDVIKQNLFKPFVTTKNNGHSGLGLSIIDKTVTELGGSISCKSRPEEGTRFTIYFPVSTG
jgi:signal transduction histidine kinase